MLTSFLHFSIRVFDHSSCGKASSAAIIDGFHSATALFKSQQLFSIRSKSGDWEGHSRTFSHSALVDMEVCLGLLSCWKFQCLICQQTALHSSLKWPGFSVNPYVINDHMINVASSWLWKQPHQWHTSMLYPGDGIPLVRRLGFSMPNIPPVHISKQFLFGLPKVWSLNSPWFILGHFRWSLGSRVECALESGHEVLLYSVHIL